MVDQMDAKTPQEWMDLFRPILEPAYRNAKATGIGWVKVGYKDGVVTMESVSPSNVIDFTPSENVNSDKEPDQGPPAT